MRTSVTCFSYVIPMRLGRYNLLVSEFLEIMISVSLDLSAYPGFNDFVH